MRTIHGLACAAAALLALTATSAAAAPGAKAKVLSPGQVGALMKKAKFKVAGVYRKGPSYVVRATGPTGNDVVLAVDGKSGKIIGLDVVKWAPKAKRVRRGSRGNAFTGDVYEFGVSISLPSLSTWVVYGPAVWTTTTNDTWIEVETTTVTWTEVTYEETITEVSYETYEAEYSEEYDIRLEEDVVDSYEAAEESIEETSVEETTVEETTVEETEVEETQVDAADDADDGMADDGDSADAGGDDDGAADDGGDDGGDDGAAEDGGDDDAGDAGGDDEQVVEVVT